MWWGWTSACRSTRPAAGWDPACALQGNLDPALVLAGEQAACEGAREVLAANGGHRGFVFNLGHGVLPASDPDVLAAVVELVHDEGTVR